MNFLQAEQHAHKHLMIVHCQHKITKSELDYCCVKKNLKGPFPAIYLSG